MPNGIYVLRMASRKATMRRAQLRPAAIQEIEQPRESYVPEIRPWAAGETMESLTDGDYVFLAINSEDRVLREGFIARYSGHSDGKYEFFSSSLGLNPERVEQINSYRLSGKGDLEEGVFIINNANESDNVGGFVNPEEPNHEGLHRFLYGGTK